MRTNASRHCKDLSPYEGDTRVLYDDAGDGPVRKHVTWRSEAAAVEVRDAQVAFGVDRANAERVEAAFADVDRVDVTADAGDVNLSVRRRLEDLGYA
jgi:hypothetical protein